jgi:flavin-dependent dehydrogenase
MADVTWDVAIIGAGPAGGAAAITLARRGLDVIVADKAVFPRDKFCGDGLTAGALRLLEHLGLDPADVPSWHPVHDVCVRAPGGRTVRFPLPGDGTFAAVARRRDLDAAMVAEVRRAGAVVCEGHALVDAEQHVDRVVLSFERQAQGSGSDRSGHAAGSGSPADEGTQPGSPRSGSTSGPTTADPPATGGSLHRVEARFVIGADGMWSPLRRRLGLAMPGYRGDWHAFRQYVRGVSPDASRDLWVLFEPDLLPGYFWSFPVGHDAANIGFGILRGGSVTPHDMKALWPDLLARPHVRALLGPDAAAEGPHRAWPIPCRVDEMVLADGRALFVGDAAAAADPMTGEGIGQALATGIWAAEAILAHGAGDGSPLDVARSYEATVRHDLVADHRFARRLGSVLGSVPAATAAIALAGLTPWTRRNFARWLFEDYPRATILTPRRWSRHVFTGPGAFADT